MPVESARTELPGRARRIGLSIAGVLGVLGVMAFMAAQSVPWGPPGTSRYETYELANRLVGLPWLLCSVILAFLIRAPRRLGVAIAFVGASMIALGSIAEFWVLTDTSYRDPLRGPAWVLFLLGHPLFAIGYVLAWWQAPPTHLGGSDDHRRGRPHPASTATMPCSRRPTGHSRVGDRYARADFGRWPGARGHLWSNRQA